MANEIVVTGTNTQVGLVNPKKAIVKSYIAAVAISAGQAVYINSSGNVALASAAASDALSQFRGIALQTVGAGQAVDVVEEGEVAGFTLTAVAYGGPVFLHDTAGVLADATGGSTSNCIVGDCVPMADNDRTKVLHVHVARELSW